MAAQNLVAMAEKGPPLTAADARLRRYVPTLSDLFFAVVLLAAFARPGGFTALLADGDTGWHIRTGELVLATGRIPVSDPFSFTRPGEPWFAWEWLSDVVFAILFRSGGLWAVAAFAAIVLALAAAAIFSWTLHDRAGMWLALGMTLAAASASSIHYLARPHIFSILFYTIALRMLIDDRRRARRLLWVLPPLCAVWANLHGGFVAWLATAALAGGVSAAERDWRAARRYGALALLCLAATFANPFGWGLHQHILGYLRSSWILDHVQEFRSPDIRTEGTLVFALVLLATGACASRVIARGGRFEGALALAWGFAAMRSARHIPFFAIAAAPVLCNACSSWWRAGAEQSSRRSLVRAIWELGQDLGARSHATAWLPVLGAAALLLGTTDGVADFPAARFPVQAVERHAAVLGAVDGRTLTPDQWADYLIFKLYPRQRVFFDGRSDFYGPALGTDYRDLMAADRNWPGLLTKYRFTAALLPHEWPLSTFLDREPGWRRVYADKVAVLFLREDHP